MEDVFNMLSWPVPDNVWLLSPWMDSMIGAPFQVNQKFKTFSFDDSVFTPRYTSVSPKSANVFFSLGFMLIPSIGKRHPQCLALEASKLEYSS